MEKLSATQTAKLLGISIENLETLEKQGLIHTTQNKEGLKAYSAEEITEIKSRRGLSIADEAKQVDTQIQYEIVSSISTTKKILMTAGAGLAVYILLISVFIVLFIINPIQTAKFLGIVKTNTNGVLSLENQEKNVLAVETRAAKERDSPLQTILKPIGKASLGLVKNINPASYERISKVAIIDPIDVLGLDPNGAIILDRPINLSENSPLKIGNNQLVSNLNSQYLQGKQPGTNPGDIAIVGEIVAPTPVPIETESTPTPTPVSGLTNENLSGSAGITNANLANPSVTVNVSSPLSGSGTLSLGEAITLSCPTCVITSASITSSSIDTLTNKTIDASLNTVSGLTASNLTAGDFSSKITSGTYSINITGSVASATNFTGSLSGDVTGTQGSTVISGLTVSKFGSANISQWTNNSGFITSSTTDTLTNKTIAAGSNTISGLTNSNLSGTAGITNANLANSSIIVSTGTGLSGGATISLGDTLTLTNTGVTSLAGTSNQVNVSGSTGSVTLSLPQNIATTSTPTFGGLTVNGAVNGLTFTSNATGFSIAGGTTSKTLTINNSLAFSGTDGTTLTFPGGSDTIAGLAASQTLTNKTLAAGSNTISGLTNTNLSGTAGITNANLANSSLSLAGNSGSGSVSLGGTLTLTGAGITNVVSSGSTLTLTSTEADTLQSVFNRGNTIPTTTGSPANSIDQATINIGNIASTAQNNFSTLNLSNGGTGYLDVELIRGFINFQGINTLYDDFTGRVLDTTNTWTSTATGGGTACALLSAGLNGVLRMTTGNAASRGCELTTQAIATLTNGYFQRGNNPIFETKLKIDTLANARIFAGFTNTRVGVAAETNPSTHHAYIVKRAADTAWQCVTDDGGATETTTSTGVTIVANTYYRLRVELRNGTTPETICTVDDGTTVTRTIVTATQPGATNPMDVYVRDNQSDAVVKNMDVDYVRAWQDDPAGEALASNPDIAPVVEATSTAVIDLEESTNLITDAISNFFKNLVEFFGNVIFYADVNFLGRPTFNKDTAGHALIKTGESEVSIVFEKEYKNNPVVTASVNLVGEAKSNDVPNYAVYDLSTKGFKIKLPQVTSSDLSFSWIALAVNEDNISTDNILNTTIVSPTPTEIPPAPIKSESPTPSPIQETIPSPTLPDEKPASTSAQVAP